MSIINKTNELHSPNHSEENDIVARAGKMAMAIVLNLRSYANDEREQFEAHFPYNTGVSEADDMYKLAEKKFLREVNAQPLNDGSEYIETMYDTVSLKLVAILMDDGTTPALVSYIGNKKR